QAEPEVVQWWEAFQFADAEGRADMLATAPQPSAASKPRRRRRRKKPCEANPADGASNDSSE
ncbi:MAG TPA: polynucleotide adenylyltransferase PcnB, partial [Thiomonas arsenitoxydans]|nr:polynucleotide adenylyltransferase PcnB [Thiomonas arsenitoxydans]